MAAWVGPAIAIAGTVVSAYASQQKGEAESTTAKYNARLAEQEAQQRRQAAAIEAEQARERHDRTLAAARARYGASGVTMEGTPLLVMMRSEEEAILDVARIRARGAAEAQTLESQAALYKFAGKKAKQAGMLGAGASLLSGVGSAFSVYQAGKKK